MRNDVSATPEVALSSFAATEDRHGIETPATPTEERRGPLPANPRDGPAVHPPSPSAAMEATEPLWDTETRYTGVASTRNFLTGIPRGDGEGDHDDRLISGMQTPVTGPSAGRGAVRASGTTFLGREVFTDESGWCFYFSGTSGKRTYLPVAPTMGTPAGSQPGGRRGLASPQGSLAQGANDAMYDDADFAEDTVSHLPSMVSPYVTPRPSRLSEGHELSRASPGGASPYLANARLLSTPDRRPTSGTATAAAGRSPLYEEQIYSETVKRSLGLPTTGKKASVFVYTAAPRASPLPTSTEHCAGPVGAGIGAHGSVLSVTGITVGGERSNSGGTGTSSTTSSSSSAQESTRVKKHVDPHDTFSLPRNAEGVPEEMAEESASGLRTPLRPSTPIRRHLLNMDSAASQLGPQTPRSAISQTLLAWPAAALHHISPPLPSHGGDSSISSIMLPPASTLFTARAAGRNHSQTPLPTYHRVTAFTPSAETPQPHEGGVVHLARSAQPQAAGYDGDVNGVSFRSEGVFPVSTRSASEPDRCCTPIPQSEYHAREAALDRRTVSLTHRLNSTRATPVLHRDVSSVSPFRSPFQEPSRGSASGLGASPVATRIRLPAVPAAALCTPVQRADNDLLSPQAGRTGHAAPFVLTPGNHHGLGYATHGAMSAYSTRRSAAGSKSNGSVASAALPAAPYASDADIHSPLSQHLSPDTFAFSRSAAATGLGNGLMPNSLLASVCAAPRPFAQERKLDVESMVFKANQNPIHWGCFGFLVALQDWGVHVLSSAVDSGKDAVVKVYKAPAPAALLGRKATEVTAVTSTLHPPNPADGDGASGAQVYIAVGLSDGSVAVHCYRLRSRAFAMAALHQEAVRRQQQHRQQVNPLLDGPEEEARFLPLYSTPELVGELVERRTLNAGSASPISCLQLQGHTLYTGNVVGVLTIIELRNLFAAGTAAERTPAAPATPVMEPARNTPSSRPTGVWVSPYDRRLQQRRAQLRPQGTPASSTTLDTSTATPTAAALPTSPRDDPTPESSSQRRASTGTPRTVPPTRTPGRTTPHSTASVSFSLSAPSATALTPRTEGDSGTNRHAHQAGDGTRRTSFSATLEAENAEYSSSARSSFPAVAVPLATATSGPIRLDVGESIFHLAVTAGEDRIAIGTTHRLLVYHTAHIRDWGISHRTATPTSTVTGLASGGFPTSAGSLGVSGDGAFAASVRRPEPLIVVRHASRPVRAFDWLTAAVPSPLSAMPPPHTSRVVLPASLFTTPDSVTPSRGPTVCTGLAAAGAGAANGGGVRSLGHTPITVGVPSAMWPAPTLLFADGEDGDVVCAYSVAARRVLARRDVKRRIHFIRCCPQSRDVIVSLTVPTRQQDVADFYDLGEEAAAHRVEAPSREHTIAPARTDDFLVLPDPALFPAFTSTGRATATATAATGLRMPHAVPAASDPLATHAPSGMFVAATMAAAAGPSAGLPRTPPMVRRPPPAPFPSARSTPQTSRTARTATTTTSTGHTSATPARLTATSVHTTPAGTPIRPTGRSSSTAARATGLVAVEETRSDAVLSEPAMTTGATSPHVRLSGPPYSVPPAMPSLSAPFHEDEEDASLPLFSSIRSGSSVGSAATGEGDREHPHHSEAVRVATSQAQVARLPARATRRQEVNGMAVASEPLVRPPLSAVEQAPLLHLEVVLSSGPSSDVHEPDVGEAVGATEASATFRLRGYSDPGPGNANVSDCFYGVFSPDGARLATTGPSGEVRRYARVWDPFRLDDQTRRARITAAASEARLEDHLATQARGPAARATESLGGPDERRNLQWQRGQASSHSTPSAAGTSARHAALFPEHMGGDDFGADSDADGDAWKIAQTQLSFETAEEPTADGQKVHGRLTMNAVTEAFVPDTLR